MSDHAEFPNKHQLMNLPADEFIAALQNSTADEINAMLVQSPVTKRSALGRYLAISAEPRSTASIVGWWEARRPIYNLIVGVCGMLTMCLAFAIPGSHAWAIVGMIQYGIAANICYSAGSICELVARRFWGDKAFHLGPILLGMGTGFSVCLTLGAFGLFALILSMAGFAPL